MSKVEKYDFAIIGGGIFGIYAALYLADKGLRVCVIEKERELMKKASVVNQARLHSGYHYPRSVATAIMSNENKARFTEDHKAFINFHFEKYYAIDRYGSFTDPLQFERFCRHIDIKCDKVDDHPLFNYHRLEALYATIEYSFDPFLIAQYYREKVDGVKNISIIYETFVKAAEARSDLWFLELEHEPSQQKQWIEASQVINATYSASNAVNELFGMPDIELMHEISEIALMTSPQLKEIGLTVMDGPFGSIMPFGLSGLLSLSSVVYTHHKVSYEKTPHFNCQEINKACTPELTGNCNDCLACPPSNYPKMIKQMSQYFNDQVRFNYFSSLFTIKSKLMANYIDDGRPTEISILNENPRFYCIFAGKINSIYEIEKVVRF
jgi:hypothetical protein